MPSDPESSGHSRGIFRRMFRATIAWLLETKEPHT